MQIDKKEHKKMKKMVQNKKTTKIKEKTNNKESLPAWFDQNLESKIPTEEEKEELDKILKELV